LQVVNTIEFVFCCYSEGSRMVPQGNLPWGSFPLHQTQVSLSRCLT